MRIMKKYLRIARLDHWIKQLFILPGGLIAVLLTDLAGDISHYMVKAILGFFATCFIASANYVIN